MKQVKPTPLQSVWVQALQTYLGLGSNLIEAQVSTVGRKYFHVYIPGHRYTEKFFLDTLKHDSGAYAAGFRLWLFKDEAERQLEYENLDHKMCKMARGKKFTLKQLRAIVSIMEDKNYDEEGRSST